MLRSLQQAILARRSAASVLVCESNLAPDTNTNKKAMHETTTPTRVLDRLLDPVVRCLSPRAARALVGLRADEEAQTRVRELAEKCNEGTLSAEERAEYEAYVMAANIVAILQAKARARLRASS